MEDKFVYLVGSLIMMMGLQGVENPYLHRYCRRTLIQISFEEWNGLAISSVESTMFVWFVV